MLEAQDWKNLIRLLRTGRWDFVGAEVATFYALTQKVIAAAEESVAEDNEPEQPS